MLVLDHHLILAPVLLAGALQAEFGFVGGGVDVLDGQSGASEEPLGIGTRVGVIGYAHEEGLTGVRDQILIGGFDLWNSFRGD